SARPGVRPGYESSTLRLPSNDRARALSPAIVSESLVRLRHLVRVLALLDGAAAIVRGIEQLARELFDHRLLAAQAGVLDQPAHGERDAPLGTNLHRDLVGGTADAPALHLEHRLDVVERLLEDAQRILSRTSLDHAEGAIDDALGNGLLAVAHHLVDELRQKPVVELRVRENLSLFDNSTTRHLDPLPTPGINRASSLHTWNGPASGWRRRSRRAFRG